MNPPRLTFFCELAAGPLQALFEDPTVIEHLVDQLPLIVDERQAGSIGVGSTGGGVELPGAGSAQPLSWEELSRDLRVARRLSADLHVFSLEGCVGQDFLPRLRSFDWSASADTPQTKTRRMELMRRVASAVLRACALLPRRGPGP